MTSRLSPKDSIFMLKAKDLDFVDVQEVRRAQILRRLCLGDLKANGRGIRVVSSTVVHGHHKAVEIRKLARYRIAQIRRECGDAALARHMIPQNCYSPNKT